MPGKSIEQRIYDAETRIRQLEAHRRQLVQHLKEQDRKERTRRLIQIGAVVSTLGIDSLEKAQALQREVESRPEVQTWLQGVLQKKGAQESS